MDEYEVSPEEVLEHFGIRGMQWGVRKGASSGIASKSTDREAAKDAHEFARAKMFYGEGAGTRRKLIKATVEAKSKRDPDYKKAFDFHSDNQDLSSHAQKARGERSRKDKVKTTKQTGGAIARQVTGQMGTKAAVVALVAGGAAFASSPRGRQVMNKTVSTAKKLYNDKTNRAARQVSKFLRNNGLG